MKRVFLILALACTISMTSCKEDEKGPGNVPLTDINIEEGKESVKGDVRYGKATVTVKFSPVPANATDVDFKWDSKNTSVATVEETKLDEGTITILKADSTIVTISSGQVTKEIKVKGEISVIPLVGIRLELDKAIESETDSTLTLVVPVGDIVNITATPNPVNANTTTTDYVTFVWTSNKPDIATVVENAETKTEINKTGAITAISTGEAKITISNGNIKAKTIIITSIAAEG
jgi:uncharacterized protein YjdB